MISACLSWCIVKHTGEGPEFHKSALVTADDGFGETARANLFQATGEGCEVRVVVAGVGLRPGTASDFARDLLEMGNTALGQPVNA